MTLYESLNDHPGLLYSEKVQLIRLEKYTWPPYKQIALLNWILYSWFCIYICQSSRRLQPWLVVTQKWLFFGLAKVLTIWGAVPPHISGEGNISFSFRSGQEMKIAVSKHLLIIWYSRYYEIYYSCIDNPSKKGSICDLCPYEQPVNFWTWKFSCTVCME